LDRVIRWSNWCRTIVRWADLYEIAAAALDGTTAQESPLAMGSEEVG
jgi:hypothetical protein